MLLLIMMLIIPCIESKDLKLKSVLVLSRHNIRAPRSGDLTAYSPKEWPKWDEGAGILTEKGAVMERHMGEYFHQWLTKEELLPKSCPEGDSVYIYCNTEQRTKRTAKAFAESAFNNCNVPVHHLDTDEMDPIFNSIVHNTSDEFKKSVIQEMGDKLRELQLTDAYTELARIIDLKESRVCKENGLCDFNKENTTIVFSPGKMLNVKGPLDIGDAVVDSFTMSYYDGKPGEEVAWGEITTPEQWHLLTRISTENEDVRFNLSTACKDIAGPLLNYMSNILLNSTDARKLTVLVGHDSNLNPVARAFNFKPYVVANQYEPFPIGGKIVFQKLTDGVKDFMKIEYVYPSWTQLRDGAKFDLDNPPQRVPLELKDCKTERGLCPWEDFVQVLNDITNL